MNSTKVRRDLKVVIQEIPRLKNLISGGSFYSTAQNK